MGILFSCTAENRDRWCAEVVNLALSVRRFGGSLADAPFVACFVDGAEPAYVERLAALDVEVKVVPRFDPRSPHSNKLRMLELAATHEFDTLIALDTDTLVVGDLTPYVSPDAVAAKPENDDPLGVEGWRRLHGALGIAEPSRSMVMTTTGAVTYPYVNTGVVMVPHHRCGELLEAWSKRVHQLLDLSGDRPDVLDPGQLTWTDQLAMALTIHADGVPIAPLPVAANLSTIVRVHPLFAPEVTPPFVIHYHNEMDERGFVFRSQNARLNPLIDAFDRALAEHLDAPYAGMPAPPLVRRTLRRVEGRGWYEQGPVAAVRKADALAPLRRQAKRLARGRAR